jgi:hypothetical protein
MVYSLQLKNFSFVPTMQKFHIQTRQGYIFAVPMDAFEHAISAEQCQWNEGVNRLREMMSHLASQPPLLYEPVRPENKGLQALALELAAKNRFNVTELRKNTPLVLSIPILDEFLAVPDTDLQAWFDDLSEDKCQAVLRHADDVHYVLTGKGQESPSLTLSHLRSTTMRRYANLEQRAGVWDRVARALATEQAGQTAEH